MPLDRCSGFLDQEAFLVFAEFALTLRVCSAVTDELGVDECRYRLGRVPVHFRIDQERNRQLEFSEQFGEPKNADTIAVVSPSVVKHVWLWSAGRKLGAQAF